MGIRPRSRKNPKEHWYQWPAVLKPQTIRLCQPGAVSFLPGRNFSRTSCRNTGIVGSEFLIFNCLSNKLTFWFTGLSGVFYGVPYPHIRHAPLLTNAVRCASRIVQRGSPTYCQNYCNWPLHDVCDARRMFSKGGYSLHLLVLNTKFTIMLADNK